MTTWMPAAANLSARVLGRMAQRRLLDKRMTNIQMTHWQGPAGRMQQWRRRAIRWKASALATLLALQKRRCARLRQAVPLVALPEGFLAVHLRRSGFVSQAALDGTALVSDSGHQPSEAIAEPEQPPLPSPEDQARAAALCRTLVDGTEGLVLEALEVCNLGFVVTPCPRWKPPPLPLLT